MKSKVTLAIIGTAGRNEDGRRLAADPYHYLTHMYRAAKKVVELTDATGLISGGAGWADAAAITLFLKEYAEQEPDNLTLTLHLPTTFRIKSKRFDEDKQADPKFDSGRISNYYHDQFTQTARKCFPEGWTSMGELAEALAHPLCDHTSGGGMKGRNMKVAHEATHLLAMTFGAGQTVKDGGTSHTVAEFLKRKGSGCAYHLDLNTCKLYKDAKVDPKALEPFKKKAVIPRELLDKFDASNMF